MTTEADRIERNNATFRRANEQIRDSAREYDIVDGAVPFICECADESCTDVFQVPLAVYREVRSHERRFLLASREHVAAEGAGEVVGEHDGFVVFEKAGSA